MQEAHCAVASSIYGPEQNGGGEGAAAANAVIGVYMANRSPTAPIASGRAPYTRHVSVPTHPQNLSSVIFSTEPLWATFVSGIFLKETMGPNALVGAAFILLACATAQSEQIMELLGMGGAKDTDPLIMQSEGTDGEGAETNQAGSGKEEPFPLLMLDEVEPAAIESELELSFDVSLLKEFDVPVGMTMGRSAPDGREASRGINKSEEPAVRMGWLASTDL